MKHALALVVALALQACGDAAAAPDRPEVGTPTSFDDAELTCVRAELDELRQRHSECEARVLTLRAELDASAKERIEREKEWLSYVEGIALLEKHAGGLTLPAFEPQIPPEAAATADAPASESAEPAAEPTLAKTANNTPPTLSPERAEAVMGALRSLFVIEDVGGLDVLEIGNVRQGFAGPVVLRVLDERGRPISSLAAERLRLEASRAARSVTLVLEHGYERRAGVKVPFEGGVPDPDQRAGVRRIVIPEVDPRPWLVALPELFREADLKQPLDDGSRDLAELRRTLNRVLREDAAGGWYELRDCAGVQGAVVREVIIDVYDRSGALEKKLFADRLTLWREARGIQIVLEDGTQLRGEARAPFLDGRYRIFLPAASADAWERAGLPVQTAARAPDENGGR